MVGERTLIQATVDRLRPLIPPERLWVLTNDHLRDEIVQPASRSSRRRQILAEPAQRNTAPAIGLAAHILHSLDPDAVMGVFPVRPRDRQVRASTCELVKAAFQAGRAGGIDGGRHPAALARDRLRLHRISRRRAARARSDAVRRAQVPREAERGRWHARYVEAGNFYWNAGMFFWRTDVLLDELRQHLPRPPTLLASLPAFGDPAFAARLKQTFPLCDNISIDYAVLERSPQGDGHRLRRYRLERRGKLERRLGASGSRRGRERRRRRMSILYQSNGNYVSVPGKTVALVGVKDLVIVETADALLIADRESAQKVGDVVKILEKNGREDLL